MGRKKKNLPYLDGCNLCNVGTVTEMRRLIENERVSQREASRRIAIEIERVLGYRLYSDKAVLERYRSTVVRKPDKNEPETTETTGETETNPEEKILEALEAETNKAIVAAAKAVSALESAKKRIGRVEKIKEITENNTALPTGKLYPVIYADPPWLYEYSKSDSRKIENQYPTMTLKEICDLDVSGLAAKEAVLFLWTTSPKLEESFLVLNSWGFTYKTCAIWDKQKIGMGYYFRQQHEILLIATKGNLPVPEPQNRVSSVLSYPKGKHSKKPLEIYKIIEKMYGEYNKIELFSRTPQEGWDSWGNQSGP